jgi:hypothetical protein
MKCSVKGRPSLIRLHVIIAVNLRDETAFVSGRLLLAEILDNPI